MVSLQSIHDRIKIALEKRHKQLSSYVLMNDIQMQTLVQGYIDDLNEIQHLVIELSETVKSQQWQR